MNAQLVESLLQMILALPDAERSWLEEKLFWNWFEYPSKLELLNLAIAGKAFDFLSDEPDIYTIEDGEHQSC